ncbi:uncharacterized protein PADG_00191 [Paracoccidioides brasiliensis Pb18]|uniref:Mediator of RNA polymerase II transcription subunit 17 n=1 Tax=Paracoccidioides brasiliensis (strain Pb18) TaxID=502780 RepID=C1G001_PARBD|nr:uncharacterized protein PADG_00191 [Paracoccidioides brasiliensis Pb18]EEH43902.1 hypothetical protein PADG_00191 [Paracoccidioides brasiliensis Pb18]
MAESFTLPLRPLSQKPLDESDSLPIRIAQINAQRGSFRNVTEQSLQEEIEARRAAEETGQELDGVESQEAKPTDRLKHVFKSRAQIVDFAMQAHAEANYALDFVSLLLSKYTPRQAEISMSPYLKQSAPLGSLETDVVKVPEKTAAAQKEIDNLSRGWKLESFDAAASKLLQSATRLEEEVAAETKYWAGILDIKEKGWKVCRLPRERQTLGVQFGFLEATPSFRDRGLAALRQGDGGQLTLDRGLQTSKPRSLRVRVHQDNQIVGASKLIRLVLSPDDPIECRIRLARDALYEEELFHEINREARTLLQHGVESKQNLIQFQANESQQILIDMVGLEDGILDLDQQEHVEDALAETVAQSLRLLLSHAHRLKYRRRTRIPPPVTEKRRPDPEYSLLKPTVGYLQHKSALRWLKSFLDSTTKTLQLAGLKCKYDTAPLVSVQLPPISSGAGAAFESDNPPFVERLVDSFLSPLESIITGTFLSPASSFKIRVTTSTNANALGTEFEIATNITSAPRSNSKSSRTGLRSDLQQIILHLFTIDLVFLIPHLAGTSESFPSTLTQPINHSQPPKDSKDDFNPPTPLPESYLTSWEPIFPENGELAAFSPSKRRSKKLTIDLHPNRLDVQCHWLDGPDTDSDYALFDGAVDVTAKLKGPPKGLIAHSWRVDANDAGGFDLQGGEKMLQDVLRDMSRGEIKEEL